MFFSILQEGDHLETGKNSKTKKEAINDAIDYLLSDGGSTAPSKVRRMSLKDKEDYLGSFDIYIDAHAERLPDETEDISRRGNQKSPFGIGA